MDLIGRAAVVAIVLIVIFSAAFIIFKHSTQTQFTSAQAEQVVLNDLKTSHPGANITVINVSNSTLKQGSYNVVLSIVYNATKPCPTLFIEAFDYPATGLAPSVDNLYTSNCVVNVPTDAPSYVISSPYIAIAESYNQHIPQVNDYVNGFGYDNVSTSARFYQYLNNTNTHLPQGYYNVWLVRYRASNSNFSVYDVLSASGTSSYGNYTNST